MGGAAATIESTYKKVVDGASDGSKRLVTGVENFVNDPGRVQNALLSGGLSESLRGAGGEAEQYVAREMAGRAPKMAGVADIEVPEPQAPIVDDSERRRSKGRASTILTGSSFGTAKTARRTLLGA